MFAGKQLCTVIGVLERREGIMSRKHDVYMTIIMKQQVISYSVTNVSLEMFKGAVSTVYTCTAAASAKHAYICI